MTTEEKLDLILATLERIEATVETLKERVPALAPILGSFGTADFGKR